MQADSNFIQDLVDANRILFNEGVLDAFGHVSARHEQRSDRFLLSASLPPALVTAADILEFDLHGALAVESDRGVYVERFIHAEIYRARPDVMAIVHSHSPSVLPFGVCEGATLRPVCHMSGFLGSGAPVFEIRHAAGSGTDLLIRNGELGSALARTLRDHAVVLMRGHGCTVVAPSIKVAVYRAIYTEINARVQFQAEQLGAITFLSNEEAHATATSNESNVERPWQLWKARAHSQSLTAYT